MKTNLRPWKVGHPEQVASWHRKPAATVTILKREYAALLAVAEAAKAIHFERFPNNPNLTSVHKSDRDNLKQALATLAQIQKGE